MKPGTKLFIVNPYASYPDQIKITLATLVSSGTRHYTVKTSSGIRKIGVYERGIFLSKEEAKKFNDTLIRGFSKKLKKQLNREKRSLTLTIKQSKRVQKSLLKQIKKMEKQ